jgi:hypothetical protein
MQNCNGETYCKSDTWKHPRHGKIALRWTLARQVVRTQVAQCCDLVWRRVTRKKRYACTLTEICTSKVRTAEQSMQLPLGDCITSTRERTCKLNVISSPFCFFLSSSFVIQSFPSRLDQRSAKSGHERGAAGMQNSAFRYSVQSCWYYEIGNCSQWSS